MRYRITKYRDNKGILGKTFWKNEAGELQKETQISFYDGWFDTLEGEWEDFGQVLSGVAGNEALGLGHCIKKDEQGLIRREGRISTIKAEAKNAALTAKTKSNFVWNGPDEAYGNVVMLDIDDMDGVDSIEECGIKLFQLYPALKNLGTVWAMPSAGAHIIDVVTGQDLTGLSGLHFYFLCPPGCAVEDIRNYIWVQSWLEGNAKFKINSHKLGVALLERMFVDLAVFSPERLDFIGGSRCSEGLEQRRGAPVRIEGEIKEADFTLIFDGIDGLAVAKSLRDSERSKVDAEAEPMRELIRADLQGQENVRGLMEFAEQGIISSNFKVKFDNGDEVPAWRLIFYPQEYAGRTMFDPLFPEKGKCKAKFYYNENEQRASRFVINSFVKGGQRLYIATDFDGVMNMLKRTDSDQLKELFKKPESWAELAELDAEAELPGALELLKKKGVGNIGEMKGRIGKEANSELSVVRKGVLEEMNDRYAYVDVGSKPRILEDTGREILLRTRADFLTAVEHLRIPIWKGGKTVQEPAGEVWLKSEEKRRFAGIEFNPGIDRREFERNGCSIYNRYRGFSVARKPERACGKKECSGQGCFQYMFLGGFGLCPVKGRSNWTYWLKTIHEVITSENADHSRWVLDWLCEMIQTPGGPRPGTALCVRGGQGTGKGSVIYPIYKILGRHAYQIDTLDTITGNFNAFMEELVLIFADEAVWGGSKKGSGKLKRLITEPDLDIEPKGLDRYQAKNYIRAYISSNSDWVVPAEDDERRYTVFDVTDAHKQDREWFARVKNGDLGELLDEILGWEIKSELGTNLKTDALCNQKAHGRSLYAEFWLDSLEERRFWDEEGLSQPVAHKEIEQLFEEGYTKHRDAYGLTGQMFLRRLRAALKGMGLRVPDRQKVRIGKKREWGFQPPDYKTCVRLWEESGQGGLGTFLGENVDSSMYLE